MNSKSIIILVAVAAALAVGVLVFARQQPPAETLDMQQPAATRQGDPSSNSSSDQPSQATATGDQAVPIDGFAFKPASITVKKGTTVTWTNQDSVRHDVVAEKGQPTGGPKGPLLAKGESYSHTFDTVGTFRYLCTPHPYMKGTVVVTE
jgi:amicyanin